LMICLGAWARVFKRASLICFGGEGGGGRRKSPPDSPGNIGGRSSTCPGAHDWSHLLCRRGARDVLVRASGAAQGSVSEKRPLRTRPGARTDRVRPWSDVP